MKIKIFLLCLLGSVFLSNVNAEAERETRYLAFQIFTYGPNPKVATMGEGTNPQLARFPDKAVLRDYIEDIKRRIGTVGDPQTRLAEKTTYSQHNNFAPPSVAFGKHHRPGFSTYPAPGRFDEIYEELARHKQVGWASCEGTNLELGSGPGQSGMTMETYLAKMFNHGGTVVNIFSWGIGGEANKNMSFRVVTEGEEALQAYRKFLKGDPLIEAKAEALTLLERLPPKIHKVQAELPAWIQKNGSREAAALMQKLQEHLKAKNFEEAEKTADSILEMMGEKP